MESHLSMDAQIRLRKDFLATVLEQQRGVQDTAPRMPLPERTTSYLIGLGAPLSFLGHSQSGLELELELGLGLGLELGLDSLSLAMTPLRSFDFALVLSSLASRAAMR